MKIAVAKEIKIHEYRVAMTPHGVASLVARGHQVTIEQGAGSDSGLNDDAYRAAGATIEHDTERLFAEAELIVKVKEPQPQEVERLQPGQMLFTYLHLAAMKQLTRDLLDSGVSAIGYETVSDRHGQLPLLHPMSLIAGRMAVQVGANLLEKSHGGRGVLLSGAPGTERGTVVVLGAGTVGENAVQIAVGMGARVVVLNRSAPRLEQLEQRFGNHITTLVATPQTIAEQVAEADLLIGAVLVAGARAPQLVTSEMVQQMAAGSVIVDVSIDQGGCVENIRPTSHAEPSYVCHGVTHYAVTNIPGAVARTSTLALTSRTLPFIYQLADQGLAAACLSNPHLAAGLNTHHGLLCNSEVGQAHHLAAISPQQALTTDS